MSQLDKLDDEIRRGHLDWGLKLWWGGFRLHLRRYISERWKSRSQTHNQSLYIIGNHKQAFDSGRRRWSQSTMNGRNTHAIACNQQEGKQSKQKPNVASVINNLLSLFILSSNLWHKFALHALLTRQSRRAYCFSWMCRPIWPYKDSISVPYNVACAFAVCV